MAAYSAIGGCKMKDGFTRLLPHRYQAAIVFQCSETLVIFCWIGGLSRVLEHRFMVYSRHAVNPFVVCLDWAAKPHAMLLYDVAQGNHPALRKKKFRIIPVI